MTVIPDKSENKLSIFDRIADKTSFGMGTPLNIAIWMVLVVAWTFAFATHVIKPNGTFLPAWFTSTGYNFPLNLVTTVLELFIGFLVGAASNRSERNLESTLARMGAQEAQIADVEDRLSATLDQNTTLTEEIHRLTIAIHELVTTPLAASQLSPTRNPVS